MAHVQLPDVPDKQVVMPSTEVVRARRACTVPDQLTRSLQLPTLPTFTVPRRYEETKPALVQNLTHQRILDFGEFINRKTREEADKDRQHAVDEAVADTWEVAQELKQQAVNEAIEQAQSRHEKQTKRLIKQHEKAIKTDRLVDKLERQQRIWGSRNEEEALKVENIAQNKLREALEDARISAEKNLQETIEKVKQKCASALEEAVTVAREEEQREAADQTRKLLEEAGRALAATKQKMLKEKDIALKTLLEQKEAERIKEVGEVKTAAEKQRKEEIAKIMQKHEEEKELIKQEIGKEHAQVTERNKVIETLQYKREQLYDELLKVHADYQDFINRHPMFDPGQTTYLLPDFQASPKIENPYKDEIVCSYRKPKKL